MATTAVVAERTAMYVVITVAGSAGAVGIVKCRGCVTLFAGDVGVRADQRKTRNVMIEHEVCDPARRNVAGFAPIAELAEMHIIVGMAAATGGR